MYATSVELDLFYGYQTWHEFYNQLHILIRDHSLSKTLDNKKKSGTIQEHQIWAFYMLDTKNLSCLVMKIYIVWDQCMT